MPSYEATLRWMWARMANDSGATKLGTDRVLLVHPIQCNLDTTLFGSGSRSSYRGYSPGVGRAVSVLPRRPAAIKNKNLIYLCSQGSASLAVSQMLASLALSPFSFLAVDFAGSR